MGITGRAINAFRARVDATLVDAYPAELMINGVPVVGSGPGGRVMTNFMDAGESEDFRFPFRIPKTALAVKPAVGSSIDWKLDAETTLTLEVCESPIRPHESSWSITCKKRRVP